MMKGSVTLIRLIFLNLELNYLAMDSIIIHPQNKKQLEALETFFKVVKIPFEKFKRETSGKHRNPSPGGDPWFDDPRNIAMIEKGMEDVKAGKVKEMSLGESEKALRRLKCKLKCIT